MRISVKGATVASGAIWGGSLLMVGVINRAAPRYGHDFLKLIASVYPCTGTDRDAKTILTRTAFGFADGAIAGCMFSLIYNQVARAK